MKQLSAIAKYWCIYAHKNLQSLEIVGSEHSVIMYLSIQNNISQDTLSTQLVLDKGTIAKILVKLEQKGLVSRVVNEQNKREKIVSLTEKGEEEVKSVYAIVNLWETELLEGISETDQTIFLDVLTSMTERAKSLSVLEKETKI
ncbi:MarR family winged helix-turn-helix transcriptional regulator [Sphaerochaeta pleomorpha]|nr:MarR family transcriptional regulator [Sphaerochaeta pleomorpha]